MIIRCRRSTILLLVIGGILWGCQTTYYAMWEQLGKEKRHLLKDQVENVRSDQADASEQFRDVVELIKEMYGFDGGDLEQFYRRLVDQYEDCKNRAEQVHARIEKVETVAGDLFSEWESEITEINNRRFRQQSKDSLNATRKRYEHMHDAMTAAATGMDPVLADLHDYVLYLKHNLNARAVGALRREMGDIETQVDDLIDDIGRSITAADEFLKTLE